MIRNPRCGRRAYHVRENVALMAQIVPNLGFALVGLFKNPDPTFYDTRIRVPQNVIQKPVVSCERQERYG
jgi:hypothetical protein